MWYLVPGIGFGAASLEPEFVDLIYTSFTLRTYPR